MKRLLKNSRWLWLAAVVGLALTGQGALAASQSASKATIGKGSMTVEEVRLIREEDVLLE